MTRRRVLVAAAGGAAALALAGCQGVPDGAIAAEAESCPEGSDCFDPVQPIGPGSTIQVEAFEWGFDVGGVAIDGPVTVDFSNTGGATHNFRIDAAAGDNKLVEAPAGEESEGVLELFAGEYTYYCDIPGHRSQGMEGDLTVYLPDEAPTDGGAPEAGGASEATDASSDAGGGASGGDDSDGGGEGGQASETGS